MISATGFQLGQHAFKANWASDTTIAVSPSFWSRPGERGVPRERSDMRRVKELLRLAHELGYSNRQISQSIRMPKTTVGDYLARAAGAGVRYADVAEMSEETLETLLFQRPELPATRPRPDWDTVAAERAKRG